MVTPFRRPTPEPDPPPAVRIELAIEIVRGWALSLCRCSHMDAEHQDGSGPCRSQDPDTSPCGCLAFKSAPIAVLRRTDHGWEEE